MKLMLIAAAALALITNVSARADMVGGGTPDCKLVTIERPNVTKPNIVVLFKTSKDDKADLLSQVQKCNEGAGDSNFIKAFQNPNGGGVQVMFRSSVGDVGSGKISLPIALTEGTASQVVCLPPSAPNGKVGHQRYATSWTGQLPNLVQLATLNNYDKESADRICAEIIQKQAQKN